MKAMILKELRENAKWALLILLVMAGLMGCALRAGIGRDNCSHLLWVPMQMVTVVGFAAAGFALGLLQIFQDSGQGRWEFLVHRPLSRSRVFAAKVMAGVAMYGLATGVALAAAVVYVASPGRFAEPFEWHMVLPRLADLLVGLVWYGAGLLVAVRPARWIGSRLMPVGVAIVVSASACEEAVYFSEALLMVAAGLVVLLPAAWGVFIAGGEYETQPKLSKPLCAIAVAVGLIVGLMVAASCCEQAFYLVGGKEPSYSYKTGSYGIDKTGRVILSTRDENSLHEHYTDLQGHSVAEPTNEDFWARGPNLRLGGSWRDGMRRRGQWLLHNEYRYADAVWPYAPAAWFYVVERRRFEGFDLQSRRYIGSISPDGFAGPGQEGGRFSEPLDPDPETICVFSATHAYRINWEERKIRQIFTTSTDDPILYYVGVWRLGLEDAPTPMMSAQCFWAVATRSAIHILHDDYSPWVTVGLEHSWPDYESVQVLHLADGRFIFRYEYEAPMDTRKTPNREWVVEADDSGKILSRIELPELPHNVNIPPGWSDVMDGIAGAPVFLALAAIHDPVAVPYSTQLIVGQVISVLVGLGLILILAGRYNLTGSQKIIWGLLAVPLGIVDVLLLMSLRERGGRKTCASCGKRCAVGVETCDECGAAFGMVREEGIEIFAEK